MIGVEPIGWVRAERRSREDDFWGGAECRIELADGYGADALQGIEDFSHAEILFLFHHVDERNVVRGARHPRNNPEWPRVGIFAQRAKNRPNRIGSTVVRILRRDERVLVVAELDAVDGTPVIDIKPVMKEFLPREEVRQPNWCAELMRQYWVRA
jgi:tRNA-Thr(GGU) m(6)t(6)A37 methyltransferase TsaA